MSKKVFFITSALAANMIYLNHKPGAADIPEAIGFGVAIAGGAGVIDKRLITPAGIVTKVDADQLAYLQENDLFKLHEKNGFLTVTESDPSPNVDAVVADMGDERDPSAPLTEGDFAPAEAPVVNAAPEAARAPAGNSRRA